MQYSIDSINTNYASKTSGQQSYSGASTGEGVFADYLSDAMLPSASAVGGTLATDPAMEMQSVMSLLLSSSMDDPSSSILSIILMYLLMGRDDTALPQVEQVYTANAAVGDSEETQEEAQEAAQEVAQEAAKTIPNFTRNAHIIQTALTRLGDPYSQELAGSEDYTDCSYLTRWCYRAAGVELPRTAAAQLKELEKQGLNVSRQELKPGDLIFYSFKNNGRYKNISHVGIYAGNNMMIDASSINGKVVYRGMFEGAVAYARPQIPAPVPTPADASDATQI